MPANDDAHKPVPDSAVLAVAVVDQLAAIGVARIFGIPGGGSSLALNQ